MNDPRELFANAAAALSLLTVLFAAPLVLGSYVVVQRRGVRVHLLWFAAIIVLLAAALASAFLGLLLLG